MSARPVLFKTSGELSIRQVYCFFWKSTWKLFSSKKKAKSSDEMSWRESIYLEGCSFYSLPFKVTLSNATIGTVNYTEQRKHSRREKSQNKSDDFIFLLNKNVSYSFWNKSNWKNCEMFYILTPVLVSWFYRINCVMI